MVTLCIGWYSDGPTRVIRFQRLGGIDQDFNDGSNTTSASPYYPASDHHPGNESVFDFLELRVLHVNGRKVLEVIWE